MATVTAVHQLLTLNNAHYKNNTEALGQPKINIHHL